MRVLFNAVASLKPKTGIGHYIENLHQNLATLQADNEIILFPGPLARKFIRRLYRPATPHAPNAQSGSPNGRVNPLKRWLSRSIRFTERVGVGYLRHSLRVLSDRQEFHLYHEPNYIPWQCNLPTIATIHDLSVLLYPEWHPQERVKYFETHFFQGLERCEHLIADTEFVRGEIIRKLGVPEHRVTTVHLGVRQTFQPMSHEELMPFLQELGLKPGYFLHVGTLEPRKNLLMLMQAFCDLPGKLREQHPLILIGGWGWRNENIRAYFESTARHAGVLHFGYVPENSMPAIYNGARTLLFPSHYEGFGFPPLEMMACGGSVLASTAGSVREILPQRRRSIEPLDLEGWREAIREIALDDDCWRQSRHGVREHAKSFTWQQCAANTWNVYENVLNKNEQRKAAA